MQGLVRKNVSLWAQNNHMDMSHPKNHSYNDLKTLSTTAILLHLRTHQSIGIRIIVLCKIFAQLVHGINSPNPHSVQTRQRRRSLRTWHSRIIMSIAAFVITIIITAIVASFVVVAAGDIDYDQFTIDFERSLSTGPRAESGASAREVAMFYQLTLIELGKRMAIEIRKFSGDHFTTVSVAAFETLHAVCGPDDLDVALCTIRRLGNEHWKYVCRTTVGANDVITPLQMRGAEMIGRVVPGDTDKVQRMVEVYMNAAHNTLVQLETRASNGLDRVHRDFENVAKRVYSDNEGFADVQAAQQCLRFLYQQTMQGQLNVLNDFNNDSFEMHQMVDVRIAQESVVPNE